MNMKHFILSGLALANFSVSAVEVVGAKLDAKAENLIVTVRHGGGCGEHKYDLELRGCAESMPAQCKATIKHTTSDFCEAYLTREAVFNLKSYGLTDSYYKDAKLTIKGDQGTSASVRLTLKPVVSTAAVANVRCMTHTGSILEIADQVVTLKTTDNETLQYNIVGNDMRILESNPPIFQMYYKIDDGRMIVTNFREGSNKGSGNFIRLDGTYSPEFNCVSR